MQTLFDNTINAVLRYAHIGTKIELDFTDYRKELLERYDRFMKIDVEDDGFDRVE
jgi:hypothetical protein